MDDLLKEKERGGKVVHNGILGSQVWEYDVKWKVDRKTIKGVQSFLSFKQNESKGTPIIFASPHCIYDFIKFNACERECVAHWFINSLYFHPSIPLFLISTFSFYVRPVRSLVMFG